MAFVMGRTTYIRWRRRRRMQARARARARGEHEAGPGSDGLLGKSGRKQVHADFDNTPEWMWQKTEYDKNMYAIGHDPAAEGVPRLRVVDYEAADGKKARDRSKRDSRAVTPQALASAPELSTSSTSHSSRSSRSSSYSDYGGEYSYSSTSSS